MRALLLLFSLLLINPLSAQERVSEIVSEATNKDITIHEYQGENYLLEYNSQDDLLVVYRVEDDFTYTFLHNYSHARNSIPFFGVFTIDSYLYTFDGNAPVKYNFITNKEIRYSIPEGWFVQGWSNPNTSYMSISCTNETNDEFESFFVDDLGNIVDDPDPDPDNQIWKVLPNYLLKYSASDVFVENIVTGEREILNTTPFDFTSIPNIHEDYFSYIDHNGSFRRFDGISGANDVISNLTIDLDLVEGFIWLDNYLFIIGDDENYDAVVTQYNVLDGSIINTFDLDSPYARGFDFVSFVENKFVFSSSQELFVLDVDSGLVYKYRSFYDGSFVSIPITDDGRLIAATYVEWYPNLSDYVLINLVDMSEVILDSEYELFPYDYANVVKVGNNYLGVFSNSFSNNKSLFRTDIATNRLLHESQIDKVSNSGLDAGESILLKFNNELVVASTEIYGFIDDDLTKVNPFDLLTIDGSEYMVYPNFVSFAANEDDQVIIYSYDGSILITEASLPISSPPFGSGFIRDYMVTDNYVYYVLTNFTSTKLMQYEKSSGNIKDMGEIRDSFRSQAFATNGKDSYYYHDGGIYHLDLAGNSNQVVDKDLGSNLPEGFIYPTVDFIYWLGDDGVYLLNGSEGKLLVENPIFLIPSIWPLFNNDVSSSVLELDFSGNQYPLLYLQDSIARVLIFNTSVRTTERGTNNHFYITADDLGDDSNSTDFIYDGTNDIRYDITNVDVGLRPTNLHFVDGIPYILSSEFASSDANIYKFEPDFTAAKLSHTIPNTSSLHAKFQVIGNEGFLYATSNVYLMEEGYILHPLNVQGNFETQEIVDKDGYVFFIGRDEEYGNQLYRVLLYSFRVSTDELRPVETVVVYPNPASSFLNIPLEVQGDFTILNQLGQVLSSGTLTEGQIDISSLNAGLHYLKIENKNKIYVTTFVKGE